MDRDSITRTGARAPGENRIAVVQSRFIGPALTGGPTTDERCAKAGSKLTMKMSMPGAGLTRCIARKALVEILPFQPYRGKPAVRNVRGDDGNVGIIRSPVRAIALLDLCAVLCWAGQSG